MTSELRGQDPHERLNNLLSVVVAIAATFLGICNVKDGNIVQAITLGQTELVDTWSYFQAKSIKQALAESTAAQFQLSHEPEAAAKVKEWQDRAARYDKEKADLQAKAEAITAQQKFLNARDDQFDLAEAFLSVSIALFGITALVRKKKLLVVGAIFATIGVVFAMAAFAGLSIHPDWLTSLLS
ncbi:MAG: DUF4337 domain-containing protein [Myxococcaceae bacterium]